MEMHSVHEHYHNALIDGKFCTHYGKFVMVGISAIYITVLIIYMDAMTFCYLALSNKISFHYTI